MAKNILVDRISEVPTTKELSVIVGININKLQQGFRMIIDKSILQFIISYRMHLTLHLLEAMDKTISEIAHAISYVNKGHFTGLFKKRVRHITKRV